MTTQIAVRLPDELVQFVDRLVAEGGGSRAAVVARALKLHEQQLRGEEDRRILEQTGDYDDVDALLPHASLDD